MSSSSGSAVAEGEGMSVTVHEMLVPPLVLLASICAGLVFWTFFLRCRSKRKPPLPTFIYENTDGTKRPKSNSIAPNGSLFEKTFRSSPTNKSQVHILTATSSNDSSYNSSVASFSSSDSSCVSGGPDRPLFQTCDKEIIANLQGQGPIKIWPFMGIITPVIFSLGFCPLTLLLAEPIVSGLWPSEYFTKKPNINDAIGCFLVPAGMVYAISFGFAFQMVIESFREVETLGFFTFLGVLLIDAQSYRAELSMCIVTVLSISLLCYVVADLDSPFYGVFLVNLGGFCDVIRKLSETFEEAQSENDGRKSFGTINENDAPDQY